jgi:hypothetical protein
LRPLKTTRGDDAVLERICLTLFIGLTFASAANAKMKLEVLAMAMLCDMNQEWDDPYIVSGNDEEFEIRTISPSYLDGLTAIRIKSREMLPGAYTNDIVMLRCIGGQECMEVDSGVGSEHRARVNFMVCDKAAAKASRDALNGLFLE